MFRKIKINNFRCMIGQKKNGVDRGGDTIIKHMNLTNSIYNININNNMDYMKGYNTVSKNLHNNVFNINLGGDHSISACTIKPLVNLYKKDMLVLWIGAHADINTYESSNTKNKHGMPVASLMGLKDHWEFIEPRQNDSRLNKSNLMYIGLRDTDDFERNYIRKNKIKYHKHFSNKIISFINRHPAKYIYISCDIDSMDPSIMPSTGTPVKDGLLLEDVEDIILASRNRLVGFDLVEFNPLIGSTDDVNKTLNNISRLLENVITK
jgi:arginase